MIFKYYILIFSQFSIDHFGLRSAIATKNLSDYITIKEDIDNYNLE